VTRRWPWRVGTGNAPPAVPAAPELPAWSRLPVVQRVLTPMASIAPGERLTSALTSWRDPRFLAPLGHLLHENGPHGHVDGLVSPTAGRAAPASAPELPGSGKAARTAQRRVLLPGQPQSSSAPGVQPPDGAAGNRAGSDPPVRILSPVEESGLRPPSPTVAPGVDHPAPFRPVVATPQQPPDAAPEPAAAAGSTPAGSRVGEAGDELPLTEVPSMALARIDDRAPFLGAEREPQPTSGEAVAVQPTVQRRQQSAVSGDEGFQPVGPSILPAPRRERGEPSTELRSPTAGAGPAPVVPAGAVGGPTWRVQRSPDPSATRTEPAGAIPALPAPATPAGPSPVVGVTEPASGSGAGEPLPPSADSAAREIGTPDPALAAAVTVLVPDPAGTTSGAEPAAERVVAVPAMRPGATAAADLAATAAADPRATESPDARRPEVSRSVEPPAPAERGLVGAAVPLYGPRPPAETSRSSAQPAPGAADGTPRTVQRAPVPREEGRRVAREAPEAPPSPDTAAGTGGAPKQEAAPHRSTDVVSPVRSPAGTPASPVLPPDPSSGAVVVSRQLITGAPAGSVAAAFPLPGDAPEPRPGTAASAPSVPVLPQETDQRRDAVVSGPSGPVPDVVPSTTGPATGSTVTAPSAGGVLGAPQPPSTAVQRAAEIAQPGDVSPVPALVLPVTWGPDHRAAPAAGEGSNGSATPRDLPDALSLAPSRRPGLGAPLTGDVDLQRIAVPAPPVHQTAPDVGAPGLGIERGQGHTVVPVGPYREEELVPAAGAPGVDAPAAMSRTGPPTVSRLPQEDPRIDAAPTAVAEPARLLPLLGALTPVSLPLVTEGEPAEPVAAAAPWPVAPVPAGPPVRTVGWSVPGSSGPEATSPTPPAGGRGPSAAPITVSRTTTAPLPERDVFVPPPVTADGSEPDVVQRVAPSAAGPVGVTPAPAETSVAIQTDVAAGTSPAAGPDPVPGADKALDELVRRLYDPLSARLKDELRLDRERAGLLTDLRH
jgi:hypothetical protein